MTRKDRFSLLVPRYLRGDLTEVEKVDFEAFLKENPDFQADIDFQRNLMSARSDNNEMAEDEFGWARLSRSIDSFEAEKLEPQNPMAKPKKRRESPVFWRVAAIVLACVSVGQMLYMTNSKTTENYQLASENVTIGTTLQIGFAPDTDFSEISDFLVNHEAKIISGPSKLGILTLSFSDKENCDAAVKALLLKEQFVETNTSCNTVS